MNMSQRLIVMRHGLRLDEVLSSWVRSAARPWDSPLAPDGIAQVGMTVHEPSKNLLCP